MKLDSDSNESRLSKCPVLVDLFHEEEDFLKAFEGMKVPLSHFLLRVFRKTKKKGKFPVILKETFIMGIFKSGEITAAVNYRPIVLTSHLS